MLLDDEPAIEEIKFKRSTKTLVKSKTPVAKAVVKDDVVVEERKSGSTKKRPMVIDDEDEDFSIAPSSVKVSPVKKRTASAAKKVSKVGMEAGEARAVEPKAEPKANKFK